MVTKREPKKSKLTNKTGKKKKKRKGWFTLLLKINRHVVIIKSI